MSITRKTCLVSIWLMLSTLWAHAQAGPFRRAHPTHRPTRAQPSVRYDYDDDIPVVDELPANGATRVKDGWYWEFRRTGPNSGTWYGVRPARPSRVDNYDGYYPRHGDVRYKDGLRWTFDSYRNLWISEWY